MPLPQFELDLEADRKVYESLKPPSSIVVRFGVMKMVGEFPYDGQAKPGCGSKLVVRTHRGVEIGEMLTSTCPNAGCSKSVTRREMLEYIENSGGRDYPFFTQGKVLRIATLEDLNEQARLEALAKGMAARARAVATDLRLPMKIVDAEPILGRERLTFHYTSEDRVDFRELVYRLAQEFQARIELRQIGARDEARLTADYERCGQHCCCKQFLKVLKPVSMKSAKVQKATLDPLKISGRCGRLMCCLRYEDQTYAELAARLPRKKSRVMTPEGPGTVIDGQILTQLVLVHLDGQDKQVAVPVEDLMASAAGAPKAPAGAAGAGPDLAGGSSTSQAGPGAGTEARPMPANPRRGSPDIDTGESYGEGPEQPQHEPAPEGAPGAPSPERGAASPRGPAPQQPGHSGDAAGPGSGQGRRRRRRRGPRPGGDPGTPG
ncbi:MAG TPA: regulatory iron-sulfur-containing complex subunit RicT [Phycisphaerales bacterium]|nr:regulatory iron-sulfur-containing complex subunit RicT [Phycisphaerales bacterium]